MLIKDAEIFAAGQWPGQGATGVSFSEADLDSIVTSFNSLGLRGRVPLKMGHDGADARTSDSAPALGWVESVRREGNKLLADIKLTSDKLAEMIRAGAYKFVSIELLRNVQAHTRQIPWVLDAVALLGATAPAVGILKDLQTSMQSFRVRRSPLRGERLAFKRGDATQPTGVKQDMDEAQVQAAIAKAVKEATDATTAKFTAELAGIKTKLDTSEADAAKARAQAHRFAVLAPIEAGIAAGLINAAAKDKFTQLNQLADDAKVMLTSAAQAEAFVKDAKDLPQFKGPGAPKRTASGAANEEANFTDMTTAQVVTFKVEQRVLATGDKITDFDALERAQRHVFSTDKHLAQQYFSDPQALYEAPAVKEDKAA